MAKFAQVTYGTKGESEEYTYVVNDSVRAGQFLQPSVKHAKSGKIYSTTGIVQNTSKTTSKTGRLLQQEMQSKGVEPTEAYTSREASVEPARSAGGKFTSSPLGRTVIGEDGKRRIAEGREFEETPQIQQIRDFNTQQRVAKEDAKKTSSTNETFESYSEPFMRRD